MVSYSETWYVAAFICSREKFQQAGSGRKQIEASHGVGVLFLEWNLVRPSDHSHAGIHMWT